MGKCDVCGKSGWLLSTDHCLICKRSMCDDCSNMSWPPDANICRECIRIPEKLDPFIKSFIKKLDNYINNNVINYDGMRSASLISKLMINGWIKGENRILKVGYILHFYNENCEQYLLFEVKESTRKKYLNTFEKGLQVCEPIIKSIEKRNRLAEDYLNKGKKFFDQKEYSAALDCLNEGLKLGFLSTKSNTEAQEYKRWTDDALKVMSNDRDNHIVVQSVGEFVAGSKVSTEIKDSVIQHRNSKGLQAVLNMPLLWR